MKMLRRSSSKLLQMCGCKMITRGSALFINGAKATETFTYITPHIDFPEQLKQRDKIQQQLTIRKSNKDLSKIEQLWMVYEQLKTCKSDLDKKKQEISRELGKLIKSDPEGEITKKYKLQIDLIKDEIRKLKQPLWSAEENAIVQVLKLPNLLHPRTDKGKKVLYTHLDPPKNRKDHLQIGRELNLIHFKKNENYYLKGDAAVFELGAKFYFSDLLKKDKFIQFSNPDFVKSVIVEGCGEDHTNPNTTFILHHNEDSKASVDNRLHLTGGGSITSFYAYLAKNVLQQKVLPLKYFSMGRQYIPAPSVENSLFHVSQSSVVQFLGASKTAADLDQMLDDMIEFLKTAYGQLGYHFRISIMPADKLFMWESLRVAVEMYSTSLSSYVEVASVSLSGDFICKRLLLMYTDNKQTMFPHVISGTVLNVPKFLGCVLEQENDFVLPDVFKVENWAMKV